MNQPGGIAIDYEFYMRKALDQARRALAAGEFPVGCVMVYENRIVATGARSGTRGERPNEVDHAEISALRRLSVLGPEIDRTRVTVFSTMEPCLMCYAALILSGIQHIVYAYEDVMGGGTSCNLDDLPPLYKEHPVKLVRHVLRDESLSLFKDFFTRAENDYWNGSFLCRYTLSQAYPSVS